MIHRGLVPAAILALWVGIVPVLAAGDAAGQFESMFGATYRAALANAQPADAVELARQLLVAARAKDIDPAMRDVLCDRIYNLGSRDPAGYAAAVDAMWLRMGKNPAFREGDGDRILTLLAKAYSAARLADRAAAAKDYVNAVLRFADALAVDADSQTVIKVLKKGQPIAAAEHLAAGEDLKAHIDRALARDQLRAQVEQWEKALEANPAAHDTRDKLVRLFVADLDDPAQAQTFLNDQSDASLAKFVRLAAGDVTQLNAADSMALAEWYEGLAGTEPKDRKPALWTRARKYAQRNLELSGADELLKVKASVVLKRLDAALAAAAPESDKTGSRPGWINVLELVDATKDKLGGTWDKSQEEGLTVKRPTSGPARRDRLNLPIEVSGSYEVEIELMRTDGKDLVTIILPVDQSQVCLVLDSEAGAISGLSVIDKKGPVGNKTVVRGVILPVGKVRKLRIAVTVEAHQAKVAAELDGKEFVKWTGDAGLLAAEPGWGMVNEKVPGLGALNSSVAFTRIELRSVKGEAKTLRDKKA